MAISSGDRFSEGCSKFCLYAVGAVKGTTEATRRANLFRAGAYYGVLLSAYLAAPPTLIEVAIITGIIPPEVDALFKAIEKDHASVGRVTVESLSKHLDAFIAACVKAFDTAVSETPGALAHYNWDEMANIPLEAK